MILLLVLIFTVSNVLYKRLINAFPMGIVARAAAKNIYAFFRFSSSLVSFLFLISCDRRLKLMNKCIIMYFHV